MDEEQHTSPPVSPDDVVEHTEEPEATPEREPVTLEAVKAEPKLKDMILINNSRLSVQPVTAAEWQLVCKMGGL